MKRFIPIFITIFLLLQIPSPTTYAQEQRDSTSLSDIKNHWAKDIINQSIQKGMVTGYPDGTFKPNAPVAIDAFVKMMLMSFTEKYPDGVVGWSEDFYNSLSPSTQQVLGESESIFDPNKPPTAKYWAQPYIDQLNRLTGLLGPHDIIIGTDYTKPMTRAQVAFLVSKILGFVEFEEQFEYASLASEGVKDISKLTPDRRYYIGNMIMKGIMRGNPEGLFKPDSIVTRAESLTIIDRIFNKVTRDPFVPNLAGKHYSQYNFKEVTKTVIHPKAEMKTAVDNLREAAKLTDGYGKFYGLDLWLFSSEDAWKAYDYQSKQPEVVTSLSKMISLSVSENTDTLNFAINKDLSGLSTQRKVVDSWLGSILGSKENVAKLLESITAFGKTKETTRSFSIGGRAVSLQQSKESPRIGAIIKAK